MRNMMRQGLYIRLLETGAVANPVIASVIAEACYPQRKDPTIKAKVGKREASKVVADYLDRHTVSYEKMMETLWGPGPDAISTAAYEGRRRSRRQPCHRGPGCNVRRDTPLQVAES